MKIEIATFNHINQISALYEEFFEFNGLLQPEFYKAAKESGTYPKSIIENEKADLIIALDGDNVIGFAHIMEDKTEPYATFVQYKLGIVVDLMVTEKYRSRGIGKALMDSVKIWCAERDTDYIELNVIANNTEAYKFYEREGFNVNMQTLRYKIKKL